MDNSASVSRFRPPTPSMADSEGTLDEEETEFPTDSFTSSGSASRPTETAFIDLTFDYTSSQPNDRPVKRRRLAPFEANRQGAATTTTLPPLSSIHPPGLLAEGDSPFDAWSAQRDSGQGAISQTAAPVATTAAPVAESATPQAVDLTADDGPEVLDLTSVYNDADLRTAQTAQRHEHDRRRAVRQQQRQQEEYQYRLRQAQEASQRTEHQSHATNPALQHIKTDNSASPLQQPSTPLETQQDTLLQSTIASQRPSGQGVTRLGNQQCVICMENIQEMTATYCGHIFCHTCIMEALMAGERQSHAEDPSKVISKCPVCRKKVLRHPKTGPQQAIPLELKIRRRERAPRPLNSAVLGDAGVVTL